MHSNETRETGELQLAILVGVLAMKEEIAEASEKYQIYQSTLRITNLISMAKRNQEVVVAMMMMRRMMMILIMMLIMMLIKIVMKSLPKKKVDVMKKAKRNRC